MFETALPRLYSLLGLFVMYLHRLVAQHQSSSISMADHHRGLVCNSYWPPLFFGRRLVNGFFEQANLAVDGFQYFVSEGSGFVFGLFPDSSKHVEAIVAARSLVCVRVLPTVIVFSSLMSVLYHIGVMQVVVRAVAVVMQKDVGHQRTRDTSSGRQYLVGQNEAPLVVQTLHRSDDDDEMNALMVGGFATITGSLIAGYASMGVEGALDHGQCDFRTRGAC